MRGIICDLCREDMRDVPFNGTTVLYGLVDNNNLLSNLIFVHKKCLVRDARIDAAYNSSYGGAWINLNDSKESMVYLREDFKDLLTKEDLDAISIYENVILCE